MKQDRKTGGALLPKLKYFIVILAKGKKNVSIEFFLRCWWKNKEIRKKQIKTKKSQREIGVISFNLHIKMTEK